MQRSWGSVDYSDMADRTTFSLIWIIFLLTATACAYGSDFPSHHLHLHDTTWAALGCWTDGIGGTRTLSAATYTDTVNMTIKSCINFSNANVYAGVEYAQECYCGNYFSSGTTNVSSSDCDMACTGNAGEFCGAGNRLYIFGSGTQSPASPILVPSIGNWSLLGCYNNSATRALSYRTDVTGSVTVESCTTACYNAGYPYAGMKYPDECYCGLTIENNNSGPTPNTDCDMTCAGNLSEYCGGSYQLSMYHYIQAITTPPVVNSVNPSTVSPVKSGLPGNWTYGGCYVDNANGHVLGNEFDSSSMTVESCIANCVGQKFTIAAIEYSTQCFCGDYLINGATEAADSDCNMACGGSATEACGGPNRLSVYSSNGNTTILPVPVVQKTSLPGQWVYEGCLALVVLHYLCLCLRCRCCHTENHPLAFGYSSMKMNGPRTIPSMHA